MNAKKLSFVLVGVLAVAVVAQLFPRRSNSSVSEPSAKPSADAMSQATPPGEIGNDQTAPTESADSPIVEREAVPNNAAEAEKGRTPAERFAWRKERLSSRKWSVNLADSIAKQGLADALTSKLYIPLLQDSHDVTPDAEELQKRIQELTPKLELEISNVRELREAKNRALEDLTERAISSGRARTQAILEERATTSAAVGRRADFTVTVLRGGKSYEIDVNNGDDATFDYANQMLASSVSHLVDMVNTELKQNK